MAELESESKFNFKVCHLITFFYRLPSLHELLLKINGCSSWKLVHRSLLACCKKTTWIIVLIPGSYALRSSSRVELGSVFFTNFPGGSDGRVRTDGKSRAMPQTHASLGLSGCDCGLVVCCLKRQVWWCLISLGTAPQVFETARSASTATSSWTRKA